MAQRNARRRKPKARAAQRKQLPGWLWFATGLGCSLLMIFLYQLTRLPPQTAAATAGTSQSAPAKQEKSVSFNFYDTLRSRSISAAPARPAPTPTRAPPEPASAKPPQPPAQATYYLQAGSFKQRKQAEKRRVELLLLNTEASISKVEHAGAPWYRVRSGPYHSSAQLASVQGKLRDEGIDTLVLR